MDKYWTFVVLFGLVMINSKTWCYPKAQLFEGSDCIVESNCTVRKSSLSLDECIEKYFEFRVLPIWAIIQSVNGKGVYEGEFQNIVSLKHCKSIIN